jgi:myosin heavy subunit
VYQIAGERNFHIFYQLTLGASEEQKAKWKLSHPTNFAYLNKSGCIEVDGVDDLRDFEEVKEAMVKLSFREDEIESVFQLIAAILQMGNIEFKYALCL